MRREFHGLIRFVFNKRHLDPGDFYETGSGIAAGRVSSLVLSDEIDFDLQGSD